MSRSTREPIIRDNDLVVEAPTAEAALEMVAQRLGTRARISGVERVRRGGIGGFFARELVQVTATVAGGPNPAPAPAAERDDTVRLPRSPTPPERTAVDTLMDRLDDVDGSHSFEQLLSRHLASPDAGNGVHRPPTAETSEPSTSPRLEEPRERPTVAPEVPEERPIAAVDEAGERPIAAADEAGQRPTAASASRAPQERPATATSSPADHSHPSTATWSEPGVPQWSLANLRRIGLTDVLRRIDVEGLDASDDSGWTHALATRLMPLCRPLPAGPSIVVGPSAAQLASVTGLPRCDIDADRTPESFVAAIGDSDEERRWLASARRGRTLHLVVGDGRWRRLLFHEPAVLSWTAGELCEAISLAAAFDLTLGYAIPEIGNPARATAVDLAVAVRRMLPTRSVKEWPR